MAYNRNSQLIEKTSETKLVNKTRIAKPTNPAANCQPSVDSNETNYRNTTIKTSNGDVEFIGTPEQSERFANEVGHIVAIAEYVPFDSGKMARAIENNDFALPKPIVIARITLEKSVKFAQKRFARMLGIAK